MTHSPTPSDNRHLIVFRVAPYDFCAPAVEVERIVAMPPLSRLPMAPVSVIGVIHHRGSVYPVISLRRKLGLETGPTVTDGQLILTRLPTGPCAFLVDEVVDVLPGARLARHSLSARSPMDLFDAFVQRGDQILFHTTFERLEQAGETPYPNPDLKRAHRMAAAMDPSSPPSGENHRTARPDSSRKSAPAPSTAGRKAPSEARPGHDDLEAPVAAPPAPPKPPPVSKRHPDDHRSSPSTISKRTRRWPMALTAVFMLFLIAGLAATFLLTSRLSHEGRERRLPDVRPPESQGNATFENKGRGPLPPVAPTGGSETGESVTSETTPAPPRAKAAPAASVEDADAADPPRNSASTNRREATSNNTSSSPTRTSRPNPEVLRLESDTFTLTVERPSDRPTGQAPPTDAENSANVVTHRVIKGDTLWDIADHYLDDPLQYHALARLSRIRDPDLIYPGDVIRIVRKKGAPPREGH